MSPSAGQERDPYEDGGDPHVRQQLESIDGSLMAGMPDDDRYSSGVPDGQRSNSLDFIQMTGLTRAPARPSTTRPPSRERVENDDLNPTAPLSFYEKGVTDVDDGDEADLDGISDALLDANLIPDRGGETLQEPYSSPSAEAFRDIVAGLESAGAHPVETPREAEPDLPESPEERSPSSDLLAMFDQIERAAKGNPEKPGLAEELSPEDSSNLVHGSWTPTVEETAALPLAEPETPEELTEDWDALIDSVNAAPAPEEVPPSAPPRVPSSGSGALAEAEQLLQALGQKQRPQPAPKAVAAEVPSLLPTYSPTPPTSVELDGELAYDYSAAPSRRRSRRHSRTARRGKRAIFLFLVTALFVGGLGTLYVYVVAPIITGAEDVKARADRLLSERKYDESSRAYDELAGKLGSDPAGVEATFKAAYVLTLGEPRTGQERDRRYRTALARFTSFLEKNPVHPKRTRALTIMGRLHYELGEYDTAIEILRDQADPLSDPQAALSMLRYLARSYSQKGEYEAAESAYLQAATLPGNYSVDQDYFSLGEMYKLRADLAETDGEKDRFTEAAAGYWRRAVQVPGIEPGQKVALKERLDWLLYQENDEFAIAPEPLDATPDSEAPVVAPVVDVPEAVGPVDGDHEVDAAEELKTIMTAPEPTPIEEAAPAAE